MMRKNATSLFKSNSLGQNIWSVKNLFLLTLVFTLTACLPEATGSKLRKLSGSAIYKDNQKGCGEKYFVFSTGNTCVEACTDYEGTHVGSSEEVETAKKDATEAILTIIENSKGVCIDDVEVIKRPTNAFTIEPTTCSCRNGKSDVVNDCDATCATKTNSANAILYLNTTPSAEVLLNDKLKNLNNWCRVQIEDGLEAPECYLKLWDGSSEQYVPLNTFVNSNSATADISTVTTFNKTYIASIVETKSGAKSGEFQIYRKPQSSSSTVQGALKITPISQYTCITYGGTTSTSGEFLRNSEARIFYYYASNETPAPVPPYASNKPRNVVCHDEFLHPGNDSAEYPRLENIPLHFSMWDKTDPRFVEDAATKKLAINKILEDRYFEETNGQSATFGFFTQVTYPNRPSVGTTAQTAIPMGYMMIAFVDSQGKAFCPKQADFSGNDLIYNILGEYVPETEALYLAEKEAEVIQEGSDFKTVYGNMFITESKVLPVAFYIENGLKIKVTSTTSMASKTIHFYWPIDSREDPLFQGNRKLYTIRSPDNLSGQTPSGIPTSIRPNDKRIGCVPKSF